MQPKTRKLYKTILLRVLPLLLLVYLFVYTLFQIHALRSMVKEWNTLETDKADTFRYTSEEWELIHHKAFLSSRLSMSESDSIGLTINLNDSVVQLEMKGVVLRQLPLEKIEISRFFRSIGPPAYLQHFSKPFTITEIEGSIEKNPVTFRKVPKDTLEAAQHQVTVDTIKAEFVEWHFLLDSAIMINIVQSDQFEGRVNLSTTKYRLRRYGKTLRSTNYAVLRAKRPVLYPNITIFLPASEAKAFFRALPENGQVVIRL